MNIEQLGAWGDFVGGIAVLGGLIFVGVQLLGANRQTRASTIQSALEMQMLLDLELAKHSDTWEKVISNSPITNSSERRKAILLFNLVMTSTENRYHQYQAGYLDKRSWDSSLDAMNKSLACEISNDWRQSVGAATHSLDFLELIDSVLRNDGQVGT